MGYRSDVVIAIDKQAYDQEMLLGVGRDDYFHDAAHLIGNVYFWVFEGTKWSPIYPEVAYIESLFDALDDLGEQMYGFVRVGEDIADIEERGLPGDYEIYAAVSIDYPQLILNTPMIGEQNAATAA